MNQFLDVEKVVALAHKYEASTKSGKISNSEFLQLFNSSFDMDLNSEQLRFVFYLLEQDANGRINFKEFLKIASIPHTEEFEFNEKTFNKNIFTDLDTNKNSLISFNEFKQLSQILLSIIELAKSNQNGKINKSKMELLFESKELSEFAMKTIFLSLDQDNNGSLKPAEFARLTQPDFKINVDTFAKNFFTEIDANKDGFISFDELKKVAQFENIPEEVLRDDFNHLDLNSDGKLSFQEFLSAIKEKSLFIDESIENYL